MAMKGFVLANVSDVGSTLVGIKLGAVEVNPFIGMIMEATSVPEALIIKLALACGAGYLISRWRPKLLTAPTVIFAAIAISNTIVVLTYL